MDQEINMASWYGREGEVAAHVILPFVNRPVLT